jgi:L-arabinokinase
VARDGRITLMLTDFEAASNAGLGELPHLQCFSIRDLAARGLHYEDLVAAADVVVSKPGYGIVSECIANGASLLYTSRGRMVEYDVFVAEMPGMLRCRFITQEALLAGDWQEAIEALLDQPQPAIRPMTNGADIAADCILETAQ